MSPVRELERALRCTRYYVDKERLLAFDVAGRCPFGDRWYRMPAACIVEDASNHLIDGSKTEGALNIDNCLSHDDHSLWGFPLVSLPLLT